MLRLLLVSVLLSVSPEILADWKLAVDGDVKVWTRSREGARIKEMKAEMLMDLSPLEVRNLLIDDDSSKKTSYVAENRTIAHPDPLTWIRYTRLIFPVVHDRDYFIEVHRDSDLAADGSGVFHSSWKPWGLDQPTRDGVVRVVINQGYWDVRAGKDAAHSIVDYYLFTDPGGIIPAWLVDMGNRRVLVDLLHSVQKETLRRRSVADKTER